MAEELDPKREGAIQSVVELLRTTAFSVEFKVKKKPAGIKVIVEVTQEQMDHLSQQLINKSKKVCIKKEEKNADRS